LLLLKW
jgi:hypothetical protein